MYFRNYGRRKTRLDKCLKSPVWEDVSTGNMKNGQKHWFNINGRTFLIFIDQCESNWVGKSHFYWHEKSEDILLTHWLRITSILFLVETIQCKQFTCIYLKSKKLFPWFFFEFFKSTSKFKNFQKKMTFISYVIPKLRIPKDVVR